MLTRAALRGGGWKQGRRPQRAWTSTERVWRYDAGNKARMHLHHLIQGTFGHNTLRHESAGVGADRVVVVQKYRMPGPEQLELQRGLQEMHREALDELEAKA